MTKRQALGLFCIGLMGMGLSGFMLVTSINKSKQAVAENTEAQQIQNFYLEAKDAKLLKIVDSTSHVICYMNDRTAHELSCVYLGGKE